MGRQARSHGRARIAAPKAVRTATPAGASRQTANGNGTGHATPTTEDPTLAEQLAVLRLADPTTAPPAASGAALLDLQARAGNQAVASLVRRRFLAPKKARWSMQRRAGEGEEGAEGEDDVDTSEFTDDPAAAKAKLATLPPPAKVTTPAPTLPPAPAKVAAVKKAPAAKKAAPAKPKKKAPAKKAAAAKPMTPGEIVKKPAPPLVPKYKFLPGAVFEPPAPPVPTKPSEDPAFTKVKGSAKKAVKAAKQHPTGKDESIAAQDAALAPPNDSMAQAKANRTDTMATAKPKPFDEDAFVAAVEKALAAAAPKNLEEAGNVDEKAAGVKDTIGANVAKGKGDAAGDVEAKSDAPPDPSTAVPKPVTPMKPLDVPEPGGMKASSAMPAPVPAEQLDFRSGPAQVDTEMADAGVTEEQLAASNEPEFTGALDAKKEGQKHADTAPAEVRKKEAAILGKATAGAAATEKATIAGAKATIGDVESKIGASKEGTKSKDELARKQVADHIEAIFTTTKTDVETVLDGLDTKVDDLFNTGEAAVRKAFTLDWETRLDDYKDRRYSGLRGKGRWVRDKFKGLPKEADRLFQKSRAMYEQQMKKLVKSIASLVSTELTKATTRIEQGRQEVATYVGSLKGDLATFGQECATDVADKFSDLDASVKEKFDDLASGLAQKYAASREAVDEEIKAAQEANKGLIDKAIDAVKGVINTIRDLKDMLFRVLAKVASVVGDIVAHPIRFLGNFVGAVKEGVSRFASGIHEHLQKGLMGWLLGKLDATGVDVPKSFDVPSMFKLLMSVVGLTWATVRDRLVKKVGAAGVAALQKAGGLVTTMMTSGPVAIWHLLLERFTDFEDSVIGRIKEFVVEKIIKGGIEFVVSLLNPAAAFIKACKMIYSIVMFFIEKGAQLREFVETVIDAVGDVARGAVGGVAEKIKNVLVKLLPLAIGFLASLIGLGGVGGKVKSIIDRARKPVHKAMDGVIDFIVKSTKAVWGPAKRAFEKGKKFAVDAAGKVKAGAGKVVDKVKNLFKRQQKSFSMKGKAHTLIAQQTPSGKVVLSMASADPDLLSNKIDVAVKSLEKSLVDGTTRGDPAHVQAQIAQLREIRATALELEKKAVESGKAAVLKHTGAPPGFAEAMAALAKRIEEYGDKHAVADITRATTQNVVVDLKLLARFGLPLASYLQAQKVADDYNAAIDVRPSNATTPILLEQFEAIPKSEELKGKTLDDDDVLLGAPPDYVGLAAWFSPSRPDQVQTDNMVASGPEGRAKAGRMWARFRLRKAEYQAFAHKMRKKLKEGQLLILEKLTRAPAGGVLRDAVSGLPFTGDHDIYQVHAGAGVVKAVLKQLEEAPFRVQHGAHVDWPSLKEVRKKGGLNHAEQIIYDRIVQTHSPGGKALLRINPKAPPTASASGTLTTTPAVKRGDDSAYEDMAVDEAIRQAKKGPVFEGFAGLVEAEKKVKERLATQG